MKRCAWVCTGRVSDLEIAYHDEEWGVPCFDEAGLFEAITLEGAQAGLSWSTILKKREGYRRLFAGFEVEAVARFGEKEVAALMGDAGIVRHEGKIRSTINNAQCILDLRKEHGSFSDYIWSFVDGNPLQPKRKSLNDIPSETEQSRTISRDLKKRGFRFVGPTTCYAFMQAVGLVNDHEVSCHRHRPLA